MRAPSLATSLLPQNFVLDGLRRRSTYPARMTSPRRDPDHMCCLPNYLPGEFRSGLALNDEPA